MLKNPRVRPLSFVILFAISLLVSTFSILITPDTAYAATTEEKAKTACKKLYEDDYAANYVARGFCEEGYLAGFQDKSDGKPKEPSKGCKDAKDTHYYDACKKGYDKGWEAGTDTTKAANEFCGKLYPKTTQTALKSACVSGYKNAQPALCFQQKEYIACLKGAEETFANKNDPKFVSIFDMKCPTKTADELYVCWMAFSAASSPSTHGTVDEYCAEMAKGKPAAVMEACKTGWSNSTLEVTSPEKDEEDFAECEGGIAFGWILCGIVNGLAEVAEGAFDNVIQPLLRSQPIQVTDDDGNVTKTFEVWSNFRLYGNIILVIALIVVVYGQSIGGGVFEAYAAKKMLPRILLTAILINISFYIVALAVDITNILGGGLASLIETPFREAGKLKYHVGVSSNILANVGGTAAVGIGIAAVVKTTIVSSLSAGAGTFALWFLVFVLIPIVLIVLAILFTLLLRNGLLVLLIMVAPVAFALYCLPNTQKYFKSWWDTLLKVLMIYPIVAVLFAIGNVLAVTISEASPTGLTFLANFLSLVALFAPLALIPFSFRIAGGVMGKAMDLADSGRKWSNKKFLHNDNPHSLANTARYKMKTGLNDAGINSHSLGAALSARKQTLPDGTVVDRKDVRRAKLAEIARSRNAMLTAQHQKGSYIWSNNNHSDNTLVAHASPEFAQSQLQKAVEKKDVVGITNWNQAIAAASLMPDTKSARLQSLQTLASTGYQVPVGTEGYKMLGNTAAELLDVGVQFDENGQTTSISGANAGVWTQTMNGLLYSEKAAGRPDVGNVNAGAGAKPSSGFAKLSPYERMHKNKATAYMGLSEEKLGKNILDPTTGQTHESKEKMAAGILQSIQQGQTTHDEILAYRDYLAKDLSYGGTDANVKEVTKTIEAIDQYATMPLEGPVTTFVAGPAGRGAESTTPLGDRSRLAEEIKTRGPITPRKMNPDQIAAMEADIHKQQENQENSEG